MGLDTRKPNVTFNSASHTLSGQSKAYANFLKTAADQLYGGDGRDRLRWQKKPPQWKDPQEAIEYALEHPWEGSTQWAGLDKEKALPTIMEWINKQGIRSFSQASHGWNDVTGVCFDTQFNDGRHEVVTVAVAPEHSDFFEEKWCPLVIQPDSKDVFPYQDGSDKNALFLERRQGTEMLDWLITNDGGNLVRGDDYPPKGFGNFLNEHILKDTPFEVTELYDIGVLQDGTPFFIGWDPLQIKADYREEHALKQWDADYQQAVMKTIHDNCQEAGWPENMQWIVETSPGVFAAKQSTFNASPGSSVTGTKPSVG